MKKAKVIVVIIAVLAIGFLTIGVWKTYNVILMHELNTDYNIVGIRWAILGAMGSWAGSVFGAIALVISILAFWQPQRIVIQVSVSTGSMVSQIPGVDGPSLYTITVKNVGLRPITVSNVYLNFGGKKHGKIFIGLLNQGSLLQPVTVSFPKRLEPGESFDYYLLKDRLNTALAHHEGQTPLNRPLYICVDEVVNGQQYYKTTWTLRNFIGDKNNE